MVPTELRIFVCTEPIDMRFGFDRLAAAARARIGEDPLSGALFVFPGRRATRLKILWFDRNGFCLLYKRLNKAEFQIPVAADRSAWLRIDRDALAKLLAGVEKAARPRRMRPRLLH